MIFNIAIFISLIFAIVIHEFSHGFVAYKLGDSTPKLAGRLTLNPLKHIDIFGTVILPFTIFFASMGRIPPIGYAKPVPINPYNFKNPKKDIMWVGLSGPASNLLIAILLSVILRINPPLIIKEILGLAILINLILCIFNLIPIPPLDGSRAVASFLSYKNAHRYLKMKSIGFVLILLLFFSGFLRVLILPLVRSLLNLLGVESIII